MGLQLGSVTGCWQQLASQAALEGGKMGEDTNFLGSGLQVLCYEGTAGTGPSCLESYIYIYIGGLITLLFSSERWHNI